MFHAVSLGKSLGDSFLIFVFVAPQRLEWDFTASVGYVKYVTQLELFAAVIEQRDSMGSTAHITFEAVPDRIGSAGDRLRPLRVDK